MIVLAPEAIEANRRGELTDVQRRGLQAFVRGARRSQLGMAAVFAAIGAIVLLFASPKTSAAKRTAVSAIGFSIAAIVAVRALSGGSVSRDLRAGRLETVEGAVGKRRISGRIATLYLEVGDRKFEVGRSTYDATPDAGYVCVYFLPRSRKLVNLEQLPDRPIAEGAVSHRGVAQALGAAARAPYGRQRNEARAELAGLAHAMEAMFVQSPIAPPPEARDPRPLAVAILGKWTNGFMTVEFMADGHATMHVGGNERRGRWSVGADGQLHADLADGPTAAAAWIVGDQLTIALGGQGMTLRRA